MREAVCLYPSEVTILHFASSWSLLCTGMVHSSLYEIGVIHSSERLVPEHDQKELVTHLVVVFGPFPQR